MRSIDVRSTALVAAIVLLANGAMGFAGSTEAQFRYNETQVTITEGFAFQVTPEDSDTPVTVVALADFEIDRQELLAEIDTRAGLLTQANENQANVVIVSLSSAERCDVSAYLSKTAQHLGLSGSFTTEREATESSHVAGACSTAGPEKIFDNTYEFRLPFDLELTAIPEPTKLGPGGGEPGKALMSLVEAIQAKDWDTASRHIPKQALPADDTVDRELILRGLALNYPSQAEVTDGLVKGKRALLAIKGKDNDAKKIKGTFSLLEDQGVWRVENHALFFDFD